MSVDKNLSELCDDNHAENSKDSVENLPTSEVQAKEGNAADQEPKIYELSIFIPRPGFCKQAKISLGNLSNGGSDNKDPYVELILPVQGPETMRELQQSVVESVEGWWLGAFSLASVELDKIGRPIPSNQTKSTVYGEFTEFSAAFEAEKFKDPSVKRALMAVNVDYTEFTVRLHVMRMRDVICSQSPGLLVGNTTPFPSYDPSQIGILGGISLFPFVRGVADQPVSLNQSNEQAEAEAEDGAEPVKLKKKKKGNQQLPATTAQKVNGTKCEEEALENLANYQFDPTRPFTAFDVMRKNNSGEAVPRPPKYLKSFALSDWNPPPHNYRTRGHYLYLSIITLENEAYEITSHSKGFYINKSTKTSFDPCGTRSNTKSPIFFHSLAELICSLSPLFTSLITETWNKALSPTFPDFFTSIAITNCLPSFPWLVNLENPVPDAIRSQLAYLMTGSTTAETLPPARDWADEFAQTRELPKKTLAERILRERIWSRLQSDFSLAAARGVISCSRGEVPALNPQEPELAWTYVLNNILFSRAEDPIGAYEHLGGTPAARIIASKDFAHVKRLNDLDVTGIYTMGSSVVDYHGKRWIAQGMIPGIFRPPDLEAQSVKNDSVSKTEKHLDNNYVEDKEEGDWEKINKSEHGSPWIPVDSQLEAISPPTTYEILYGSADIEKPEMGLRSDPKFHQLAARVAEGFNLAEHSVKDLNGHEHQLWLSADVHGIRATDGRCYLIDLYRMTPVDIMFIENDLNGPILDGSSEVHENSKDQYPHKFTVIRMEAVAAFKQHKFRQYALKHIQNHKQNEQQSIEAPANQSLVDKNLRVDGSQGNHKTEVITDAVSAPFSGDPTPLESESFEFSLNPDVFVDRRQQTWAVPQEEEDQSMVTVRELSNFVRNNLILSVVQDLSEVKGLPADGRRLSDLLHSHGVNIRYLGKIAHYLQLKASKVLSPENVADDQVVILKAAIGMLQSEMVFRACKYILNQMLGNTSEAEACHCISHFLNCLFGSSKVTPSTENFLNPSAPWRLYTIEILRAEITTEIRRRFRYALPDSFFTQRLPRTKLQLLREICTRMGIQLTLRDYQLYPPSQETAANVALQSTDDENGADGTPTATEATAAVNKTSKKKKKIFSPEDILNLLPVVRDSTCRSSVADELYAEGRKAFAAGDIALGQELCTDALATHEQVFGSIHPEMCRHWHSLAILYHQLSQRALVELSESNDRLLELSALYQTTKNEEDRQKIKQRIEIYQKEREPEAAKNEIDTYIQLAANNLRQSVIVAERTLGLDHPETIQQYSDLSVMEYHLGNSETAMRYTKHALDLWHLVYGPGCHPDASASVQSGRRDMAVKYGLDAVQLFTEKLGPDHEQTKHACNLNEAISRSIEAQIKGDEEKSARLAKRLGLDPKRAASLRSRLISSSSNNSSTTSRKASSLSSQVSPGNLIKVPRQSEPF
ncbi:clustered mitochondria-domain-containing protein [Phakopsora pachyrhizi]|uniref:Clustered mitochondria-domain-containing protein n=1 Tax=Phakopsora pachyrhizi TaxID=170000 RepID=A0AAV0BSG6_PHAPC|nr:clustered mitochondria-domain-containing protein [Phakopsora pachyrhizi]